MGSEGQQRWQRSVPETAAWRGRQA
jgi:hypothetical protein